MKILKLYILNWKENLALIIVINFFRAEQYVEILYFRNANDNDVVILI